MGSLGQDSLWAGKYGSFLNLSPRASGAQIGLDIVEQMLIQFRMAVMNKGIQLSSFSPKTWRHEQGDATDLLDV